MKKRIITMLAIAAVLATSGCGKKAEPTPSADVLSTPAATAETEKSSGGSSPFSGIGDAEISMNPVDPVKVSDAEFNFNADDYAPKLQPVEAVKPVEAHIHFEAPKPYLNFNLTETESKKLEGMDQKQIEKLVSKKTELLNDLIAALQESGVAISVDINSGEIIMDSAVLFGNDEYTVSPEGKAVLDKFLSAYTPVVLGEKYKGFVSNILVEGHTDTNGSHDYNMTLSQNRADSVKAYCVSGESKLAQKVKDEISPMLLAKGYSFDRPIKDANGNVDMAASRRVTFRFLLNID